MKGGFGRQCFTFESSWSWRSDAGSYALRRSGVCVCIYIQSDSVCWSCCVTVALDEVRGACSARRARRAPVACAQSAGERAGNRAAAGSAGEIRRGAMRQAVHELRHHPVRRFGRPRRHRCRARSVCSAGAFGLAPRDGSSGLPVAPAARPDVERQGQHAVCAPVLATAALHGARRVEVAPRLLGLLPDLRVQLAGARDRRRLVPIFTHVEHQRGIVELERL
mmetsp:Transcript_21706/g.51516  ORF Transcript_21706/g.51516 Transcript_21706/m.51516 type:complete len:222 (+) Transcript_21706:35-700(+)